MSIDITLSIDDILDHLTMGQTNIVSEVFRIADHVLADGGKLIVQRILVNSAPETVCVIENASELSDWVTRLNGVQAKIAREQLES